MAEQTVIAIGRNIFPSRPSRVKTGTYTATMMRTPKRTGRATSPAALVKNRRRWLAGSATKSGSPVGSRSARLRMKFSIITTAPSTIRPKSIAPRLIRFAETPKSRIPKKATSMESGMTEATISDARTSRRKKKSTAITRSEPSRRFFVTVWDGAVDDLALVVEGSDLHARRQRLLDLGDPRLHPRGHVLAVLALEHDDHARHRLALPVAGDGAAAGQRAHPDVGHVPEEDRHALDRGQHDAAQVLDAGGEAAPAHGEALGAVLDEAAAEGGVVVGHRLHDLAQGQAVAVEAPG